MNRADALALVEPHLTAHRYVHTIGVADTALELADHTSVDKARLELAAIFHDYAKFRDKPEMRAIIEKEDFDPDFLSYGDELLHAPAGSYLVKKNRYRGSGDIISYNLAHNRKAGHDTNGKDIISG